MKKILSLFGTITLIGTSATSLVACNTTQYTEEQIKEQKEKNNLNINGNILEWIAPQEKPFNNVDDKYYFVVWKTNNWNITKFKNNTLIDRWHPSIELDSKNEDENYKLNLEWIRGHGIIVIRSYSVVTDWPAPRFKYVYRWNKDIDISNLVVDKKTGQVKIEGE